MQKKTSSRCTLLMQKSNSVDPKPDLMVLLKEISIASQGFLSPDIFKNVLPSHPNFLSFVTP